jgi:hypothetical protein
MLVERTSFRMEAIALRLGGDMFIRARGAQAMVEVKNGDGGSDGNKVMLAVEIPLMVLAISTVALRIYSRLAVKRKLAVDDVLIVFGMVRILFFLHW